MFYKASTESEQEDGALWSKLMEQLVCAYVHSVLIQLTFVSVSVDVGQFSCNTLCHFHVIKLVKQRFYLSVPVVFKLLLCC